MTAFPESTHTRVDPVALLASQPEIGPAEGLALAGGRALGAPSAGARLLDVDVSARGTRLRGDGRDRGSGLARAAALGLCAACASELRGRATAIDARQYPLRIRGLPQRRRGLDPMPEAGP
jgi:hypothetical protein